MNGHPLASPRTWKWIIVIGFVCLLWGAGDWKVERVEIDPFSTPTTTEPVPITLD